MDIMEKRKELIQVEQKETGECMTDEHWSLMPA
jgi:hypothetical protein